MNQHLARVHRSARPLVSGAILIISACLPAPGSTQESAKIKEVSQATASPDIDGRLSPGEWDDATVIRDLHQVTPLEYSSPSEETVFYVTYDETALYVAAVAYDDPGHITAKTLRQGGSLNSDDTVSVLVDAFNNDRSGYSFAVNPHGVREDGIYTSGTRLSDEWDGIWRAGAEMTDEGWTAEMAIPFNTLTFDPQNDTWGFNVSRKIQRNNEDIGWSSRNGRVNPTVSGELQGFNGINQGMGLDIIPAISSTAWRQHINDDSETELRPSLDVNYKLTPAITLLLTLNTDFSATEVDGRQLDVGRFSLFFPEKRSFFLTDFDIFQFGGIGGGGGPGSRVAGTESGNNGLPFYSRRIGLSASREPVPLIGGLKLSGRIGSNTDFGTLYVRQDEFQDVEASDLFIGRITRGVLSESSVGAIVTHGDPTSNESSSLIGVDFNYRNTRLPNNRALEGIAWIQQSNNESVSGDDIAWSVALGMPSQEGLDIGGQIHEAQENYDPRLGFANRVGVRLYSAEASYRWINPDSYWFQRIAPRLQFSRWEYLDTGLLQTQEISFNYLNFRTSSNDALWGQIGFHQEVLLDSENPLGRVGIDVAPGKYEFSNWSFNLRTSNHRPLALQFRVNGGDYYDGERYGVRPELSWRMNDHVGFEVKFDWTRYDFGDAEATTRQISLENEIAFSSSWSLVSLVQYDNLSNDIGINTRLHYNRAAGQDIWLVFNQNLQEFDPDEPGYLNDDFRRIETLLALKFRFTFRF